MDIQEIVFTEEFLYIVTGVIVLSVSIFFGRKLDFETVKNTILDIYNKLINSNK